VLVRDVEEDSPCDVAQEEEDGWEGDSTEGRLFTGEDAGLMRPRPMLPLRRGSG
jgi:hypothetical protein